MNLIEKHDKMPDHHAGKSLVVAGPRGMVPLVSGARMTWGERLFGGYKTFFLVDTSVKLATFDLTSTSAKSAMDFDVKITLNFQINDPLKAVEQNLSDPRTILLAPLQRVSDEQARGFGVDKAPEARQAIQEAVRALRIEAPIAIVDVAVVVKPDAKARDLMRRVDEEHLVRAATTTEANLDREKRGHTKEILNSPDELMAQYLITRDEIYRQAFLQQVEAAQLDKTKQLELLRLAFEKGVIEPHEMRGRFDSIIEDVIGMMPSLIKAPAALPVAGPSNPEASTEKADGGGNA